MASRAFAACLLLATLSTSSARPSNRKGTALTAKLKDASGQQAFCDHFSSICTRICKREKEQVTDFRCAPQSVKLSDYTCRCSTVDHTKQVLTIAVRGYKPVTRRMTQTVRTTMTVPGPDQRLVVTTSTDLITTDVTETIHSTPTSFETTTPTSETTYTSRPTYTEDRTWTSVSTQYVATETTETTSTFYNPTGPWRRDLAAPTPPPAIDRRDLAVPTPPPLLERRKPKPRKSRKPTNDFLMASRLSKDFCKKFDAQCALDCRKLKSTATTLNCSSKHNKWQHKYSLGCVCKTGWILTNTVVNELVPKRKIVSVVSDASEVQTATAAAATVTEYSSIVTTIHGTLTTLQVAATVLATTTAPIDLTTITVERGGCGANVYVTPVVATEFSTMTATRIVPLSAPTAARLNLLANGGFETGDFTSWQTDYIDSTLTVGRTPAPYSGNFAMTHAGSAQDDLSIAQELDIPSGNYEMGCWVKIDDPQTAVFDLSAQWAYDSPGQGFLRDQMVPGQWSRVSWRFYNNLPYSTSMQAWFGISKISPGPWYFDNCFVLAAD